MSKKERAIGWVVGLLISVILPKLTSPLELTAPFDLGGTISGMLGFGGMFWFLNEGKVTGRTKFGVAAGALVIGLGMFAWYRAVMLSPAEVTPGPWIEAIEFALYCVAYFCIFAVLGYVYWYGGPIVFRMFER
jgi:hypothetical protein